MSAWSWRRAVFVVGALSVMGALSVTVAGPLPVAGPAWVQEDDLSVVKRAVALRQSELAAKAGAPAVRVFSAGREARWLKVRILEKGSRKGKVSINLPLALVRALGDLPIQFDCHDRKDREKCSIRVSEVLRALEEGGEDLVLIEDDEATVRIWLE